MGLVYLGREAAVTNVERNCIVCGQGSTRDDWQGKDVVACDNHPKAEVDAAVAKTKNNAKAAKPTPKAPPAPPAPTPDILVGGGSGGGGNP
jgi:hypothetical protein